MRRSPGGMLLGLFGIRSGEGGRALLIAGYLFLVICAYLIIKAVRSALFISEFGALKLPYVMIGIALLAGLAASLFIRLARRFALWRILVGSLLFFASNVLLFWWPAREGARWLVPVIYLWAGIYGVVATTQVWTLANDVLTTRQAKRLFGFIGAGGVLGGAVGGWLTDRLAPVIGTPQLLLVVAGALVLAAGCVGALARYASDAPPGDLQGSPRDLTQSLQVIAGSKHLRLMSALVFVSALATTSVDFQFSVMAERYFDSRDELAAFFGLVYSTVAIIAFAFQLLLTSRVLRHLGVGFSILLLPAALLIGTAALLATGALWAAVAMKGSDGAFKHALDRSSRELMYLPLPTRIKLQAKSTIDTVMDRMGDGSAGVLQLVLTSLFGLGLVGSLWVNFVILGAWATLALKMRTQYVQQLRSAVGNVTRHFIQPVSIITERSTNQVLERMLEEGTESERVGALEWIRNDRAPVDPALLARLAESDPSETVRRRALEALLAPGPVELPPALAAQLEAPGRELLHRAVELAAESDPEQALKRVEALPGGEDPIGRLALIGFVLRNLGEEFEPFAAQMIDRMLQPGLPEEHRASAVEAFVFLPPESPMLDRLAELVRDRSSWRVASAAMRVAGELGRTRTIGDVVDGLGDPRTRPAAATALTHFGKSAVEPLADRLVDPQTPRAVRMSIPTLLARHQAKIATDALVTAIDDEDPAVRERALRAALRVRKRWPTWRPFDEASLIRRLDKELFWLERGRAAGVALRQADAELDWLHASVEHCLQQRMGRLLRLLALYYPPADMFAIREALQRGGRRRRANALELIDNVVAPSIKKRLVAFLEGDGVAASTDVRGALASLIDSGDDWLAACAFNAAGRLRVQGLVEEARAYPGRGLADEEARAYLAGAEA